MVADHAGTLVSGVYRLNGRKWLFLALAIYLALAFWGLWYGLPNKNHILSYVCDEEKWIEWLSQINPSQHRFNPHPKCHDPTLYLWMYGATLYVADKVG